jgi:predicted esterase
MTCVEKGQLLHTDGRGVGSSRSRWKRVEKVEPCMQAETSQGEQLVHTDGRGVGSSRSRWKRIEKVEPCMKAETSQGEKEALSLQKPASQQHLKKWLMPFLKASWTSDKVGLLDISGDPCSGRLMVKSGAADANACVTPHLQSAEPRMVRIDDNCMWLEGLGLAPLKLIAGQSYAGKHGSWHAVWVGSCGERELWSTSGSTMCSAIKAPESAEEALHAGHESLREGKFEGAVRHFSLVVNLGYIHAPAALLGRARAHVALGEPALACADAVQSIALQPDCPLGWQVLGMAKLAAGDYAGARDAYCAVMQVALGDGTAAGVLSSIEQCLWEAERRLLMSRRLAECHHTFDATNWELREVWDFCRRGGLLASAVPLPRPDSFRQFALDFTSPRGLSLPYLLTVPAAAVASNATDAPGAVISCGAGGASRQINQRLHPLIVYLHSAASADVSNGDIRSRLLQLVAQEAPHSIFVDGGKAGLVDDFIGIAPCCPPNLASLGGGMPKALRRRKIYWFKSCDASAYAAWDFTQAERVFQIELLVTELLAHVCEELPVDPSRIYFVGSSGGGYGVLRLGELLPQLPAAIVPIAGYYPDIPGQDHDPSVLADRLRGTHVWPMHCKRDRLCRLDRPDVQRVYRYLQERNGVQVEWVDPSIAKGSSKNFHSANKQVLTNPDRFFQKLGQLKRPGMQDASVYLRQRLKELLDTNTKSHLGSEMP